MGLILYDSLYSTSCSALDTCQDSAFEALPDVFVECWCCRAGFDSTSFYLYYLVQVFTYVILKQNTSWQVLVCCSVIIGGFLLGLKEEDKSLEGASISIIGVVSGVLASLCVALYAIFTKKTLSIVGDNIWRLQFYNNLNAVVFLSLVVLWTERPSLYKFNYWLSPYFWILILLAGIFGIAIGYVTALQIQVDCINMAFQCFSIC